MTATPFRFLLRGEMSFSARFAYFSAVSSGESESEIARLFEALRSMIIDLYQRSLDSTLNASFKAEIDEYAEQTQAMTEANEALILNVAEKADEIERSVFAVFFGWWHTWAWGRVGGVIGSPWASDTSRG